MNRRDLLRRLAMATAGGVAAVIVPKAAEARKAVPQPKWEPFGDDDDEPLPDIYEVYAFIRLRGTASLNDVNAAQKMGRRAIHRKADADGAFVCDLDYSWQKHENGGWSLLTTGYLEKI